MKLTGTQLAALRLVAKGPMARGLFSGWGPRHHGYGAHRIDVREATANKLIALGAVSVVGAGNDATLVITDAGREALRDAAP